jgi:predicted dehydrogenase
MAVKIGFIGCGGIAGAHMSRLAKLEDVKFSAMCDVDSSRAEKAAANYGGKVYTDFRKMLNEEEIDACFICVPPFAHIGQEELCIEKKVPFFVEKPVHLKLKLAQEIAKKVRAKGIITSVGYVLRYFDVVNMAKETLKKEQVSAVLGRYFGGVPGEGKGWYSKKALSGGQLVEQATHTVDMMRCLLGDIKEVFSYRSAGINKKIYEVYDVEDTSTTLLKFKSGYIGNLTCTWLWSGYNNGVDIVGKGFLLNYAGNSITIEHSGKKVTYISSVDPMLEEDRAFIKAVAQKDSSFIKSDYPDAVKTLAVSLMALESMRTGKPIKL